MMVTHMLTHLDGDDFSQFSGQDRFLNGTVERRVAQHVADHDFAAVSLGGIL